MRKKAADCDVCKHMLTTPEGYPIKPCAKGHMFRFYRPRNPLSWYGDYGHKRRCSDFKASARVKYIGEPK